jgi:hypothetical protein
MQGVQVSRIGFQERMCNERSLELVAGEWGPLFISRVQTERFHAGPALSSRVGLSPASCKYIARPCYGSYYCYEICSPCGLVCIRIIQSQRQQTTEKTNRSSKNTNLNQSMRCLVYGRPNPCLAVRIFNFNRWVTYRSAGLTGAWHITPCFNRRGSQNPPLPFFSKERRFKGYRRLQQVVTE